MNDKSNKPTPPRDDSPIQLEDLAPRENVKGGRASARTIFGLLTPPSGPAGKDASNRSKREDHEE